MTTSTPAWVITGPTSGFGYATALELAAHGTVILKRKEGGESPAVSFNARLGDDGHVRWWCHSTKGNMFDPGTWRVHVDAAGITGCLLSVGATVASEGSASST